MRDEDCSLARLGANDLGRFGDDERPAAMIARPIEERCGVIGDGSGGTREAVSRPAVAVGTRGSGKRGDRFLEVLRLQLAEADPTSGTPPSGSSA
jgi:hypothetical protein